MLFQTPFPLEYFISVNYPNHHALSNLLDEYGTSLCWCVLYILGSKKSVHFLMLNISKISRQIFANLAWLVLSTQYIDPI